MLRIALRFQDVLMALSLSLFVLIRKSFVSLLGLLDYLLFGRKRFVSYTILFICAGVIFVLLRLCGYCAITGLEKLAAQNLIEAELCSHRDGTVLLYLLFHLPLINRFNYFNVLDFFNVNPSDTVPALSSESHTKYARAHGQSNEPQDTANDSPFDFVIFLIV